MRTKKRAIIILFTICIFLSGMITVSANDGINVYLDGELLNFDVPPIIQNGRTLVPMRTIFEKLGATVEWDGTTQTAKATNYGVTVSVTIGSSNMTRSYVDSKEIEYYTLDTPATIINGRTLIPIRAVVEKMGYKVEWDGDLQVVYIE